MLKLSLTRGVPALLLLLLCLCLLASARPEGGPHRNAAATEASSQQCDAQGPRQECGWNGIPASECLSKGCCFSQAPARQGELSLRLPSCFRPNGGASSYSVSSSTPLTDEAGAASGAAKGTLSQLSSAGPSLGPDVQTLDFSLSLPAPDVARLTLGAAGRWSVPASVVPGVSGVERRAKELLGGDGKGKNGEKETFGAELEVEVVSSPSFAAVVRRKEEKNGSFSSSSSSSSPLLDTRGFRLVFKDQYIELTTRLPEGGKGALYGLGERTSSSNTLPLPRKGDGEGGGGGSPLLTLWTRDAAAADADQNSYGSWPVAWFVSADSGATSALAMLNSNAIDIVLSGETLTWRLAGGQVDLFVLSGPTPASVARQLASLVGSPTLQPPWAFGAMNSKYGYASAAQCRAVVDSFDAAGVPLEAWVSDSQYMSGDRIFTWGDDFSKSEMRDFVRHLRATGGRRWVPILDPVVRAQRGYAPYDEAAADGGIFIRGADGKPYLGQMWPGAVHWPDFLDNPATQRWWTRWLRQVREDVGAIDGVWLDMNEVSNFCSGDVCRPPLSKADPSKRLRPEDVPPNANFVCLLDCEFGPFEEKKGGGGKNGENAIPDSIFSPPYAVNSAGGQRNLSEKTLPVSARHPRTGALEYDAHNLYGHSMARASAEALVEVNKIRPFLYTRSSFLGTGAFSGHWTGDTSSSWRDLRRLTPSVLQSGLALIPFVGGDVGGFMNGASCELAERWIAAASLHPFFRFHHAQGFQEPFRRFAGSSSEGSNESSSSSEWGPVRDAARASLGLRYRLLPTLYSAAAQASATGCPTARPLWFLWPRSKSAREQAGPYAVGDALVVAPALEPGADAVELLLPSGVSFFDFYSRKRIGGGSGGATPQASMLVSLPAPRGRPPPLLVVAGGVVAVAGEEGQVFNTTSAARAAPLTLLVALPVPPSGATTTATTTTLRCGRSCKDDEGACGDIYLDKGDELDPGPTRRGRTLSVDASSASLRLSWPVPPSARGSNSSSSESSSKCEPGVPWPKLSKIVVFGAGDSVSPSAALKARVTSSGGGAKPKVDASLGAETGALELTIGGNGGGLQLKCGEDFEVDWK